MRTRILMLAGALLLGASSVQAALIEKLMGLADDGVTPVPNLPVHTFFAVNHQRIVGNLTRQQAIDMLGLTGAQITEYDALAALAPVGTTALAEAQKAMFLEGIHSALLLGEIRAPGYATPAEVRAKLGLP